MYVVPKKNVFMIFLNSEAFVSENLEIVFFIPIVVSVVTGKWQHGCCHNNKMYAKSLKYFSDFEVPLINCLFSMSKLFWKPEVKLLYSEAMRTLCVNYETRYSKQMLISNEKSFLKGNSNLWVTSCNNVFWKKIKTPAGTILWKGYYTEYKTTP